PSERSSQVQVVLEAATRLQHLLGGGLVLPEIRLAGLRFDFAQVPTETSFVKAPSVGRRRGQSGRCRRDSVLRRSWIEGFLLHVKLRRTLRSLTGLDEAPAEALRFVSAMSGAPDQPRWPAPARPTARA